MVTTPAIRLPSRLLRNTEVLSSRDEIFARLSSGLFYAEVGVVLGERTRLLIERTRPTNVAAIDRFELDKQSSLWGRPVEEVLEGKSHRGFFEARFRQELNTGLLSMIVENPEAGLGRLADASRDIVLLDSGHSYDEVYGQMHAAAPKLRRDGMIVINDYAFNDTSTKVNFYGVVQSVNDFMVQQDWEMRFLALHPQMFLTAVIRRCRA